ncbi:biotin--[acetyl-CoA-carboxylase] ligase [Acidobacteriota bacterium]
MAIYTDSPNFLKSLYPLSSRIDPGSSDSLGPGLSELSSRIFGEKSLYSNQTELQESFSVLFAVESAPSSHYDLLIEFCREEIVLPDGTLCLAGSSDRFHGQRGRPWLSLPGNIHLAVYLVPHRPVRNFGVGFSILAAVSLVETIDRIPDLDGEAGIKWVNDILIKDSKVAGFLAFTQSQDEIIQTAVLGIGLNVEQAPKIQVDHFVPAASSLWNFVSDPSVCELKDVFPILLERLSLNYKLLMNDGCVELLDRYRKRSVVLGKEVIIRSDPVDGETEDIARGKVLEIGQNLELFIEGRVEPVWSGRLILLA